MSLEEYENSLRSGTAPREPGALPPHYPSCFGCGPESEYGLKAISRKVGEEIHCAYAFSDKHAGAPGIAHGGAVAALVDDVCGFLLFVVREPAVTRQLEVEYLKPVLVGVTYDLVARVERREGRKLFISCSATSPSGEETFRGNGLFIIVDLSHFNQGQRDSSGGSPTAL
ncbi:MAG: Thioesterase superfamily protein [Frankiales bacterium]|nr:Thioesterase superfamily protein [Frankiales bacterium]